jgi:hypothetical protein
MLDAADKIVHALNDITPLGLAAGLAFVIYSIIAKKGSIRLISDNHLSGLPEMFAMLQRIEQSLAEIRDTLNYLKGRLNGKGD